METSAIAYRVVDFLKGYPPFQAMEDADLLVLVAGGRVRFHESDEFVYWQGNAYDAFFFVIQQGSVALWESGEDGERLRDMRGPGDLLGIDRFLGAPKHLYSARAQSDVVLYSLPAAAFTPLLEKYPSAARYLEVHGSVSAYYEPPDQRRRVHKIHVYEAVRQRRPPTCPPEASLRDVAARLEATGASALAVVDGDGGLRGVVGRDDLLRWLAQSRSAPAAVTAGTLAKPADVVVRPDATAAACLLAMAEAGRSTLPITEGGRPEGRLLGLVSEADLSPAFGEQPLQLLREIEYADDLGTLRLLNQRGRRLLAERLITPSSVDWLAELAGRIDAAILRRAAALAGVHDAARAGEGASCWFLFGASGRGESLTALLPRIGLVADDAATSGAARYVRLHEALVECGYLGGDVPSADVSFRCATEQEWRERFRSWVADPVTHRVYRARPLFDVRPVAGSAAPVDSLRELVRDEVASHPGFVRLLAHDSLANLPPMTFFHDLVVAESGERSETFELERSALRPLVDVGRVFGIAGGRVLEGSTLDRLDLARTTFADHEAIFREARDAFRVMLFHQTRAGLRHEHGGVEISPADLSHQDRQVLKSGFRAIARLLAFAGEDAWAVSPS